MLRKHVYIIATYIHSSHKKGECQIRYGEHAAAPQGRKTLRTQS